MPTFREAARFWFTLGFINFGGPAGQIALMHRELVERRKWIGEDAFLRALNFCMLLPGPEAQQLATYVGWRLHGTRGGLLAGICFVLPSVAVLLLLSWLAVAGADNRVVQSLFYGVQPVVVAIVAEAVLRLGRRAIRHRALLLVSAAAFVAIYFLSVPFPLIVLASALAGVLLHTQWPAVFATSNTRANAAAGPAPPEPAGTAAPGAARLIKLIAVFVALWLMVVGSVLALRGSGDVLSQEALFFTKAAFVTFGGAYAVLTYVADVAVNDFRWLTADQMVQGLGLAESTPGPLIMVTQYVAFLGAWNHAGSNSPLANAVAGSLLTTYVTFLPCFFFILAGAPYIERLTGNARLQAALTSITAAVVGVILNLRVFFASRVLIHPPSAVKVPLATSRDFLFLETTLDLFACVLAVASFVALWRFKLPVHWSVLAGAVLGFLWHLLP